MSIDEKRMKEIFLRWYNNEAGEEETEALLNGLAEADSQGKLTEFLDEVWAQLEAERIFSDVEKRQFLQNIIRHKTIPVPVVSSEDTTEAEDAMPVQKRGMIRGLWPRIAIAASIILLLGAGYWLFLRQAQDDKKQIVRDQPQYKNDVPAPAINKATLTLANGKVIVLEDAGVGLVKGAGNAKKINEGEIAYSDAGAIPEWHTLTVPRGSKPIQLKLADGTLVWLNVASSITYPTVFTGNERKITIRGEAYFEVVPQPLKGGGKMTFFVEANGVATEVLGTHFNVNAYEDEKAVKVTLLEGSVKVATGGGTAIIKPGEQAAATSNSKPQTSSNIDVDEAIAWTKGRFQFNDANVEAIMRQISRWYNVEVVYKAKPVLTFGGKIDRNSSLVQMLTILQTSGLRFSVEGNTVTVLP